MFHVYVRELLRLETAAQCACAKKNLDKLFHIPKMIDIYVKLEINITKSTFNLVFSFDH